MLCRFRRGVCHGDLSWNNHPLFSKWPYTLIFRIIKILHLTYITNSIINLVLRSMAPKNASKARSTGPETPLRRSTRGKLGETAHVQETIDTKSSARKGKQSTVADPINSPQKILHQRGRSKKQEGTVGLRQSQVLEESVQAGSNLGEGVGTRSARGAAEQERLLLESAL